MRRLRPPAQLCSKPLKGRIQNPAHLRIGEHPPVQRPQERQRSGIRLHPARSAARLHTASNIGSVSLPVKVFC